MQYVFLLLRIQTISMNLNVYWHDQSPSSLQKHPRVICLAASDNVCIISILKRQGRAGIKVSLEQFRS